MLAAPRCLAAISCPALLALLLGACGSTVSTSSFTGESHEVAQAIANLQSDVTAGDQQKICSRDLAQAVVRRLDAAPGGCTQAIKEQLAELDSNEVSVQSVALGAAAAKRTARAQVKSIFSGKTRTSTLSLVREGDEWKIAAGT